MAGLLAVFGLLCLADLVSKRFASRRARKDDVPEVLISNQLDDRFSRRALAVIVALLVGLLLLGGAGQGFHWWPSAIFLSWQRGPSDWIVTVQLLAIVVVALAALAFFPDIRIGERFRQWRLERREEKAKARLRLAALLDETELEKHPAARLLRRRGAMNLMSSMELYRMMVDQGPPVESLPWKGTKAMLTRARKLSAGAAVPPVFQRDSWENTVRHEAGHAVARAAFGSDSYYLEIDRRNQNRGHEGRVLGRDFEADGYSPDLWAQQRWVDTVCLLAGELAERNADPHRSPTGSTSDWFKSVQGPLVLSTRSARLDGKPLANVLEWLQAAHHEASQIIEENSPSITRIISRAKEVRSDGGQVFLSMVELRRLLDTVPKRDAGRVTGFYGHAAYRFEEEPGDIVR